MISHKFLNSFIRPYLIYQIFNRKTVITGEAVEGVLAIFLMVESILYNQGVAICQIATTWFDSQRILPEFSVICPRRGGGRIPQPLVRARMADKALTIWFLSYNCGYDTRYKYSTKKLLHAVNLSLNFQGYTCILMYSAIYSLTGTLGHSVTALVPFGTVVMREILGGMSSISSHL